MKLIQISDLHLSSRSHLPSGMTPLESFDAALVDIEERHPDTELIVVTGDLVDDGSRAGYMALKERLRRVRVPVALILGNHDDRAAFLDVYTERGGETGFVQAMHELSDGRALMLDTLCPGRHHGELCTKRLAWFEAQLAAGDGPFWIFMHHNPIPTHLEQLDRIMLAEPQAFGSVIERHREKIGHIFHGHTHLPMSGSLHGVPVSCTRGNVLAGFPNYGQTSLLPHSDLPASYSVIIAEPPVTTVMMVEYGLHAAENLAIQSSQKMTGT